MTTKRVLSVQANVSVVNVKPAPAGGRSQKLPMLYMGLTR